MKEFSELQIELSLRKNEISVKDSENQDLRVSFNGLYTI